MVEIHYNYKEGKPSGMNVELPKQWIKKVIVTKVKVSKNSLP